MKEYIFYFAPHAVALVVSAICTLLYPWITYWLGNDVFHWARGGEEFPAIVMYVRFLAPIFFCMCFLASYSGLYFLSDRNSISCIATVFFTLMSIGVVVTGAVLIQRAKHF